MFDFGMRLKSLRLQKKLSQHQLSKKIHKSKSTISGYENNVKMPPLDVLISLALLYNVSIDYIAGIDKKEMVSIDELTTAQKKLIHMVISEFKGKTRENTRGLSKNQQEILSELIAEFVAKE